MATILDIGTGLVITRRVRGMTQNELGQIVGVRQQQVARWEATAYRNASLERVDAAAQALGFQPRVSPAEAFLAAEGSRPSYGSATAAAVAPVRDLGEVAARIRADTSVLSDEYGFGRIGVFGSFATGGQTPGSDVDLLVEFADRDKIRGFRFMEAADHLEDVLGRAVDLAQPHLLKDRLRPRVMKDVVYVWSA